MKDLVWNGGKTRHRLTKKQQNLLHEVMKGGSIAEACERAGCARSTYYKLVHNEKVGSLLPESIDFLLGEQLIPMIQIMISKAMSGSAKHGELVCRIAGLIGGDEGTRILQVFGNKDESSHDEISKRVERFLAGGSK